MLEGLKIFIRAIVKGITGFVIIPIEILVDYIQPDWETASTIVKIFTGILFIPMVIFVSIASPWWDDFDIA